MSKAKKTQVKTPVVKPPKKIAASVTPPEPVSSKKKGRSAKAARAAGLQFEREVAQMLRHIFPETQRQLEVQTSDCAGVDLRDTDIFKIQCKNHAGYVSVSTIREVQIKDHSDVPVLITKGIRQPPMAVLPFDKFIMLLEIAYGHRERLGLMEETKVEDSSKPVHVTEPSSLYGKDSKDLPGHKVLVQEDASKNESAMSFF